MVGGSMTRGPRKLGIYDVLLVAAIAACLIGATCKVKPPTPDQICLDCALLPDANAQARCKQSFCAATTPTPIPTPTATATPTNPQVATQVPVATSIVAPILNMPTVDGQCPITSGVFIGDVRAAEQWCEAANPDWFGRPGNIPNRSNWTPWYVCVATRLIAMGYDSAVDSCNCGDIELAKPDGKTSEIYHVLVGSSGDVALVYTGTCAPRAFTMPTITAIPPSGNTPTATPVPTQVVQATPTGKPCPVLATIRLGLQGNWIFAGDPGQACTDGACHEIGISPGFNALGCRNPFNASGPTSCVCNAEDAVACGNQGNLCEPQEQYVRYSWIVKSGYAVFVEEGTDTDANQGHHYKGSIRGIPGSVIELKAFYAGGQILDNAWREVDMSTFQAGDATFTLPSQ
jgi:hypothetical protein